MKLFDNNEAPQCAAALLDWFAHAMRPLPWRTTYHPYEVWISEIMLQQTQMERGVRYFQNWMERFPDIAAVAAASEEDILHAWEGLGYYRRARFIQKAANIIMEQYGGKLPDTPEALGSLPGLGDYTVAAILSIAFNQDVLCIDANVERVFARLLNLEESPANYGHDRNHTRTGYAHASAGTGTALQSGSHGAGSIDLRKKSEVFLLPHKVLL